jgi:hypothetical protein
MNDARQYRLLPSRLPEAQKQIKNRYLVPQLSIIAAVVVISTLLASRKVTNGSMIGFALFAALFITYMAFVAPLRMRRTLSKCWNTYVLTIGPDYLLRQQADSPDIRLRFNAVKRIEHLPGRYLRVIGNARYQVIGIPESVEDFQEVFETVSRIGPITNPKRDRSLKTAGLMACGFVAYMVMLWSHSPQIVLPLAAGVSVFLIWYFVYLQRNPNVLRRTKRTSWFYLVFVLVCGLKVLEVLGRMHAK